MPRRRRRGGGGEEVRFEGTVRESESQGSLSGYRPAGGERPRPWGAGSGSSSGSELGADGVPPNLRRWTRSASAAVDRRPSLLCGSAGVVRPGRGEGPCHGKRGAWVRPETALAHEGSEGSPSERFSLQ